MPELPEVQTTVSGLQKVLPGLVIRGVWADVPKFKVKAVGYKILGVQRRGKNILINLSKNKTLLVHMKMTGHLMYGDYDRADPYNRFIHFVLRLSNGSKLVLSDARKFAHIKLLASSKLASSLKLGPDALQISFKEFQKIISNKTGKIKRVLMNQEIIAGIGNIYSDEILWLSDIHPEARSYKLGARSLRKIFDAMKKILRMGIKFGGDSTSDYRNIHGKPGNFHYHHRAYQRTGEKCGKRACSGIIKRILVGQRSAHFCPVHQQLVK